ncbi:MAG: UMP kinase [Chloroflexi bacterium]|nr:UMP kinase [Chloroflexota bacterium]
MNPIYQRVVIKLSGEALAGPEGFGIDPTAAQFIAETIKSIHDSGVQVTLVIGAGNIWRGSIGVQHGMEPATADYMGMIATVMNAMAVQDSLERCGVETRVQTAVEMNKVAEPYIRLRAIRHMEKGRVVIIAGGIGNPFFTTDTAGVLRAVELNADAIIKATKVDGVYDKDPKVYDNAIKFETLTFQEALERQIRVMDLTAIALCMEHNLPLVVLNFWKQGELAAAIRGETVGTLIGSA